jgi:tetratricopeptide (TPR) repeat protein
MMKTAKILLSVVMLCSLMLFLIQCGSDPAVEGEKAFESANYNLAIKHFLEARKSNPAEKQTYEEKIALSYMLKGKTLYERNRNVKSFSGNFEKSLEHIPDAPSDFFKKEYSKILFALGQGYQKAKPENEIQKEEYLNKSIQYLEDALYNDENNASADSLLEKIKRDNFQKMLNKGEDFYTKAGKTNNGDHYITAEYYFQRASYFDIYNDDAKKMLSKTRKKTLSVLNNREDFAMAVADMNRLSKSLILDLTIKNYATSPVKIILDNFELVDLDGKSYSLDKTMMGTKFKGKTLKDQELAELKFADGIIVFAIPKRVKIDYLGYRLNEDETVKKYFP